TQPPTDAPLLISPAPGENTRDNTPSYQWSAVAGAARYEIWVDNDLSFSSPEIRENTTAVSYTSGIPLVDNIYYWRVRAVDNAGNVGINWSDTWWLRVDNTVTAPTLSSPTDGKYENDNAPTFSWAAVADPSSPVVYRLQISRNSAFTSIIYDNGNVTGVSVEIENQLPDNVYYWRVMARDNLNNENWSAYRMITVDVTPPSSSVNQIIPYWQNSPSFTITATASDAPSGVERATLWYRYSTDNVWWSNWTENDNDLASPWSWTFTPPNGDGFYQFYTTSKDRANNAETAPGIADASCGSDSTSPGIPALVSPENANHQNDNTPFFDWGPVSDSTGPNYTLQIDNMPNFSTPRTYSGITVSEYYIPGGEALQDNRYYWRVRAYDSAGNTGSWSETRWFVIDTIPPGAPVLISPENGSGFDDNTPYFGWNENIDNWVSSEVLSSSSFTGFSSSGSTSGTTISFGANNGITAFQSA
ncbi:MAG: hypothetical protein AB1744_13685, partial [Candidatus Zixiibacteriota bacterium]